MRGAIAAGAVIAVGIAAAVCYIKKLKGIAEKALAKRREKRAHAIASVASMGSVASMESVASMASMASITIMTGWAADSIFCRLRCCVWVSFFYFLGVCRPVARGG